MSDSPVISVPDETQTFAGRLFGRKLSSGADPGLVGLFTLSPATPKRINGARRYWPELDPKELEIVAENEFADRDGTILSIIPSDPLLGDPEQANVTGFTVADGRIYFLQATGETLAGREAARLAFEDGRRIAAEARAQWLRDQPQQPLLLPGATCELRASVRELEDHGAQIKLDEWGAVAISLPERLVEGGGISAMAEVDVRKTLDAHAAAVVACWRVIAPLLGSNSRKPLSERVPAGYPTLGGGLT